MSEEVNEFIETARRIAPLYLGQFGITEFRFDIGVDDGRVTIGVCNNGMWGFGTASKREIEMNSETWAKRELLKRVFKSALASLVTDHKGKLTAVVEEQEI